MTTAQAVLDAVADRLDTEPETVLPVLELIADPDSPGRTTKTLTATARRLNADRLRHAKAQFRAGALDTIAVRDILGGVSRQAVAQRVSHGSLLAAEIAGRLYFPDWQFTDEGPLPRLKDLIGLLVTAGRGALAADTLMRTPLPEENGASPADLLRRGQFDRAVHYVTAVGAGL
jgi:hypothetical protein